MEPVNGKNARPPWWRRLWWPKRASRLPKVPETAIAFVEDGTDSRIPQRDPDVLVELGRDMAATLLAHPEKYAHALFGNQVLVVDNATYDALFYLFSGMTRNQLWDERQAVAALFLGRYCVMSQHLFQAALDQSHGPYGNPF